MSLCEIIEVIHLSTAQTFMANAFRCAIGAPLQRGFWANSANYDRYRDARRLMRQRYGVRM